MTSRHAASLPWPKLIHAFEYFLVASVISDKTQKKYMLLHVVGSEFREIYETLQEMTDDYKAVKKVIDINYLNRLKISILKGL